MDLDKVIFDKVSDSHWMMQKYVKAEKPNCIPFISYLLMLEHGSVWASSSKIKLSFYLAHSLMQKWGHKNWTPWKNVKKLVN